VRALLGAPILRDRRAVLRQAHNLKVARATRAPASSLAVVWTTVTSPVKREVAGSTPAAHPNVVRVAQW
jgi:hypothetical protein